MAGSNYQRKKSALLLLEAILETCTDTWSPERKKGQPPCNMAALLSWVRSKGYWDFFSRSNTLLLLSCLQDGTNEIRELASELLVRYFPPTFPEPIAVAVFACAQEAVSSPRVQEVEAGAVLMKTILQKSDDFILKQILANDVPAARAFASSCRCLCFLKYLLGVLRDHSARAHHDLLQAARTTPMHGVIAALRRCLLEVPEVTASMLKVQQTHQWRLFLGHLVNCAREISALLLGVLQGKGAARSNQQAAAPSFAEMGNAIGCLIRLGKGLEDHDSEDLVLLSEEHSLILTCCWVSVKEIGLLLGGLIEKILPLAPPSGGKPLLPLQVVKVAAKVFQEILLKCRHWGAVEGCSMGFTKFCAALLRHPDPDLQEIPREVLDQGLALLSSPRSSSVTRRAAGFPMLFLCIVAGEDPPKSHPLLAHCIQTLLALAGTPIHQDWDQTLDLPQVSAVHVLQTLVRGSGLGTALHPYVTSMVTLSLKALGSPSWAMRNAAIQLLSALTVRLLGQKQSRDDGHSRDRVSPEALFSHYPQLKSILLGELTLAAQASRDPQRGKFHLCPSLYAILSFLAKLQPSTDSLNSIHPCFVEPLFLLAGNPIYAVRVMAAKALVPLIPVAEYGNILLRLTSDLPLSHNLLPHNALHGSLLQMQSILAQALSVNSLPPDQLLSIARQVEDRLWLLTPMQRCPLVRLAYLQVASLLVGSCPPSFAQRVSDILNDKLDSSSPLEKPGLAPLQLGFASFRQFSIHFLCSKAARLASPERVGELCLLLQRGTADEQMAILTWMMENEGSKDLNFSKVLQQTLLEKLSEVLRRRIDNELLKLYLEAFVHLYSQPSSWNLPVSLQLMGPAHTECTEILLSMVESDDLSPACFRHALCGVALLLSPGFEDVASLVRWCAAIERCSSPLSAEVRRMAAATSLKLGGASLVGKAQESPSKCFRAAAVRLIDVAISLLQDEEREVRHEASIFASLASQLWYISGALPQSSCDLLQSNKGLLGLLQLLLEKFWDCSETFASLVHHLPAVDLSSALTELETKGAVSLYKEDEPNVYAEPAVLAQTLFPFLFQLLSRAPASPKLWGQIQSWLETTGPGVWSSLQHCLNWWSQDNSTCLCLKALSCPKVHAAVSSLLVQALLVAHALGILEEEKQPPIPEIHFSSQDLRGVVLSVQELLSQHGIASTVSPTGVHFSESLRPFPPTTKGERE
ncbi:tRNA (32-2'-O)-methyltransferase regulator THADA-like isoform X2 [Tiliqua scincoides]|uniref:tRNA (32-2'-O)-methyltransferase regulator THADA-like isoform X2 n=1 Tax=Tiliqua scincoides TaxID=71010 RepID=UPI003461E90F